MSLFKKIGYSYSILPDKYRKKFKFFVLWQTSLPILDVLGIFILGLLIQILTNLNFRSPNTFSGTVIHALPAVFQEDDQRLILLLASVAAILFIAKGILAATVNWKTYYVLTNGSLEFSSMMSRKFFSRSLSTVQKLPSVQVSSALNEAVNHQIVSILGSTSTLLGEFALILSIGILLLFYNVWITIFCAAYFLVVYMVFQNKLQKISSNLAMIKARSDAKIRTILQESIESFRELFVINVVDDMLEVYDSERKTNAISQAKIFWINSLPKYVFESILVFGVVVMILADTLFGQNKTNDFAIATFLIAGARLLPSILRVQAASNTIIVSYSYSFFLRDFVDLINESRSSRLRENLRSIKSNEAPKSFDSTILINNLSFVYDGAVEFKLEVNSLQIKKGERVALVGISGSGKSTFADLILGILSPTEGNISLSGLEPAEAISHFPGKIGYVAQQPNLISSDVFGNIALYKPKSSENVTRVWRCLELANLTSSIKGMPSGIETEIGERGYKLSGGQRQRLSLARALFPNPELLLLDEATSALDAETEFGIQNALEKMPPHVTIIVIAHRLSTIRTFDRILYFENGKIIADGTFDHVRTIIPSFETQAQLSGF